MLYLIGIIIAFFLAILLLTKKNKSEADKILAIWLFFIWIHLSLFYLHSAENYFKYPYFLGFELPLPFLHAPFLYLYTASLTNQSINRKYIWLHFLPILLTYLFFLPFLTSSITQKIYVYQHQGIGYQKQLNIMFFAIIISGITYVTLSLLLLKKHKKNIADQFSYLEKINLNWLRYLILGISLIWVAVITRHEYIIFSTTVFYVIFIGYFGIKQVGIFTQNEIFYQKLEEPKLAIKVSHEKQKLPLQSTISEMGEWTKNGRDQQEIGEQSYIKYQKSSLNQTDIREIHQQLTLLMQNEKLYKNPELTLSELAQKLDVHPNNLSQVINSIEQKNFYDYINFQRVEEFKNSVHLPENQKITLLSIAYECGFNSKTSFNRNFKKVTDFSPTEYLKQANINLQ
jgi:AraC-like DNA-binding protein